MNAGNLNSLYLPSELQGGGLILDFSNASVQHAGGVSYGNKSEQEEPRILGYFDSPETDFEIIHHGMTIKKPGETYIALPECFDYALPLVNRAARDYLATVSAHKFSQATMDFVVQRNVVEPDQAHRPNFSTFHTHPEAEFIYSFNDSLPTVYRDQHSDMISPENALIRFGGKVSHSGRLNHTEGPINRLWGALAVYSVRPPSRWQNNRSENSIFFKLAKDAAHFAEFKQAATQRLAESRNFRSLEEPQTLREYAGLEPNL